MFGFDRAFAQSRKSAANLVGHHKHAGTTRVIDFRNGPKGTFPSAQRKRLYQRRSPARKTKREMEMSKKCGGSTVSRLACGEV